MPNRVETRAAISALLDAGDGPKAIAEKLGVGRTTVFRVKKKAAWGRPNKGDICYKKEESFDLQGPRRTQKANSFSADEIPSADRAGGRH